MERPFVVCHMLASLDGKIDGAFFGAPQTAPALQVYGELRGFYSCQSTLYGTTTMLGGYADGKVSPLSANGEGPLQYNERARYGGYDRYVSGQRKIFVFRAVHVPE